MTDMQYEPADIEIYVKEGDAAQVEVSCGI